MEGLAKVLDAPRFVNVLGAGNPVEVMGLLLSPGMDERDKPRRGVGGRQMGKSGQRMNREIR
jgi:hypothetical protein